MRNRNRSFVIRLSDEEFQALEEKRKKSGYPREVFLRHLIADGTVREAPSVDYPKLLLALSRIGNNLNQLTATANTIHYIDPQSLEETTGDLKHILKEIHRSFLIPDQRKLTEEIISDLQYIFWRCRNTCGDRKQLLIRTQCCNTFGIRFWNDYRKTIKPFGKNGRKQTGKNSCVKCRRCTSHFKSQNHKKEMTVKTWQLHRSGQSKALLLQSGE